MAPLTQQKASERVVVLLRPKEKRNLERLARKEKVSSAEIMRRSLEMYAELEDIAKSGQLIKVNTALDRIMQSIQKNCDNIDATLRGIEDRRKDPVWIAADKQLDELVRQAAPKSLRKAAA